MTSACVKWGHALGFSGSLGEFDKLSLNFEVKVTSPRSKLPRGALSAGGGSAADATVRRAKRFFFRDTG